MHNVLKLLDPHMNILFYKYGKIILNHFQIIRKIINCKKIFTVAVKDSLNNEISRASESSKKKAEQKVSMLALLKYGQLYSDQIVEDFD